MENEKKSILFPASLFLIQALVQLLRKRTKQRGMLPLIKATKRNNMIMEALLLSVIGQIS